MPKELTPVRTGFPVYPLSCPYMESMTDEEEVILYRAVRAPHGPNITVVKDLGLCDRCEHTECKEHPDYGEYAAAKAALAELKNSFQNK